MTQADCYRAAFERAPVGLAVLDLAGCCTEANHALVTLLGADPVGRPLLALDAAAVRPVAGGEAETVTLGRQFLDGGGLARWAEVAVSAVGDPTALPTSLVCSVRDVTDQRAAEIDLIAASGYDELTGLPNRTVLLERLGEMLAGGRSSLALLVCDIDGFGEVNDAHGHHVGDRVLAAVAGRITSTLRPGDLLARVGGDELAVLCNGVESTAQAEMVAERVLASVSGRPVAWQGVDVPVTVSVGVARPADGRSASAVLDAADGAAVEAKSLGRNRVALAS